LKFRCNGELFRVEGSSATDYVTDITDVTDVRKKKKERWLSAELEPPCRERMRVKKKTYPL
jgi:hypothetical protein